jgi:hypothetical protein
MGSAFRDSKNVVVTSETYNQRNMRQAERDIASIIIETANEEAETSEARLEDITFDIHINVTYAQSVFDAQLVEEMEDTFLHLLRTHNAVIEDIEDLKTVKALGHTDVKSAEDVQQQWMHINFNLAFKLRHVQPVSSLSYSVTAYYKGDEIISFSKPLGADIYLGLNLKVVNAIFHAAQN